MDSPNVHRDTRVKVVLVARPLFTTVAKKYAGRRKCLSVTSASEVVRHLQQGDAEQ
jgi:hypothetical protein